MRHGQPTGLTDDVDLAVVRLNAAAATPRACVEHVAEIPALAYVAAGICVGCGLCVLHVVYGLHVLRVYMVLSH